MELKNKTQLVDITSGEKTNSDRSQKQIHGFQKWFGRVVIFTVVLMFAGVTYENISETSDSKNYPPPGQLVDIGGYRLHINCQGTGSPTVVIEAGLGDWSGTWGAVQGEVAKTTRVCTYDRAGMGWSDPSPLPRDASQFAKEIKILLNNANINGPYLMVGHSLGGLPVRIFTHNYPTEVVGLVFVDSMFPGQTTYATQSKALSFFSVLARFGVVRLLARPLGMVTNVPLDQAAHYAMSVQPQMLQTFAHEIKGIPAGLVQAGAVESFGSLPLIVLSRGLDQDASWQDGQVGLSKLSSVSQHSVAKQSGHLIQLNDPDAVVAAIIKVVKLVRHEVDDFQ